MRFPGFLIHQERHLRALGHIGHAAHDQPGGQVRGFHQNLRDGLIKGTDTAQGQLLMSLWRLKGFAEVSPAYQAELDKSLKAYPAPKK